MAQATMAGRIGEGGAGSEHPDMHPVHVEHCVGYVARV